MSTGSVTVRLNLNSAGYSAEMTKAEAQMKRLQLVSGEFGHSTVSQMQAASASIRVLEGGISNNIRAAERFISMLPGVGGALQAAFPVVGAIALAGVFVRVGEEVANFIKKLNEIPENPFAGMIASSKLSNDQLAITNDRLQLEIDKLEHKPQNRMALALDQMREASEKLFDSLEKSNAAFDQAMGKGGVGAVKGAFKNITPTDQADAAIKRARAGVQAVRDDHQSTIDDALASGDPENIKQAREALMVDLQKAYAVQDAALRAGLTNAQAAAANFRGSYSVGSDPKAVIQRYSGALQISTQDQASIGGQYGNSLLTGQSDVDQDKQDQSERAKEAARKALQGMQDALEQRRAQYGVSVIEERSYWQQRESAFKAGSDAYREVVNKVAALEIQMQRQQSESLKAARAEQGSRDSSHVLESASAAVSSLMKREGEDVLHTGERWKAYNDAVAKAGEIQAANAAAFDKTRIALELANGQISKLDAAEQMAGVHAREFASDLKMLQAQRKQIEDDGDLTDVERQTALKQNSNSGAALQGQYQAQQLGDQQAIADQQLGPAMKDTLSKISQDWSNMTSGIIQVTVKALDSFNEDITKLATGQGSKADFGKTLTDAGQGLFSTALKSLEGNALKALGLGGAVKADGSQGSPFYVLDASQGSSGGILGGGGGDSGGGGFLGGIFGKIAGLFGGGGGGGGDAVGGIGDALGGALADFGGALAGGGDVLAGHPYLVGERGPELYMPKSAGSIIPNHKLGGGDTHVYNVDARGSNDPAAIHAAVARALPHAVAASIQAQHQSVRRSPRGR